MQVIFILPPSAEAPESAPRVLRHIDWRTYPDAPAEVPQLTHEDVEALLDRAQIWFSAARHTAGEARREALGQGYAALARLRGAEVVS